MSNKFLGSDITNMNLTNGTATIYAGSLGSQSLNSSMPVKTNSLRNLVSSKLDIADINNLQSELDSGIRNPFPSTLIVADLKTDNIVSVDSAITTLQNTAITNPSASNIEAQGFIVTGGTNQQYLMANGSVLQQSAVSGNSNFYLYNSNNTTSGPPNSGQIRFNNAIQKNATMVYISHLTRDNIDIEVFYNQITQLNDVYIQDQESSQNYIKYNINGLPIIIPNNSISIPVDWIESGGTGETSFNPVGSNNHNIMVSFFSNLTEIDERISTVENKTRNQSAISGTTTFSGNVFGGSFAVSGQTGFLKANGNIDNNTYLTTGDASSTYLAKAGGTLTNQVTTNQTVFNASNQLVSKNYVDTALTPYITSTTANNTFLPFTGGALTNQVTTNQTVFNASNQLVSKNYVDTTVGNYLPLTGGSIGNNYITTTQTVFNDSTQLVPKTYVDTAIGIGTNNTTERWINSYIGVDTNSGSILKPLATINVGFGNSAQYPLKLNIRGVFTALQTLTASNANTQITTNDGWEAQQTTLSATVITSGTMTRLKMSGFTITTGTSAVLTIGDTQGRHAFSNIQFVSSNATPITFNAGFTNWCNFQDCDFSGLSVGGIILPALTGTAILRLYNCGLLNLITATGWTVYISGSTVLATSSNLATGTIIQLPINQYNAVLTVQPTWSSLAVGNYINMVGAGLTGVIGTPSTGCCIIKVGTGVQVVSLGYNQLPSSINVLNSVSLSYDTFVRTKGAVGWVVVDQSAYVPLVGGVSLTGQISTNQTPSLPSHLVPKNYVDTFLSKAGGTMTGNIDMGAFGITTNQTIFAGSSVVTKTYVDNYLPLSGSIAMTGNLNMGSNSVSTTQSSFTSSNLVTKTYVDNAVSGSGSVYLLKAGGNLNYDAQLFNYCNIPIDIPYLTACLFFSGSVAITMYSTNADFSAPTGYKYIGNTAIASIQQTNTSNYNKLIKYAFSTSTGAYFSAGFLCDNTWLFRDKIAGACALYIGMGWKVSFNFSIGDTVAGSQTSGMAIGFYTSTTAPNWSASLKPSTLPNFFGIGNDNGGNFINFFSNGSTFVSNTATTYPTATPQTDKWFNLTMYNPPMTNDVVLILNEVLGNTSITQKYTFLTNNSTINPNMPLYPMMQRYHGSPTVAGQAVLNVGKFTIGLLIN